MSSFSEGNPHETMIDYFFQQHQIATDLILSLTNENERKIASKWLHLLYEDERGEVTSDKLLIVQGLILMLNANTLVEPLNEPPYEGIDIADLSTWNFINLVNYELNKLRPKLPPEVTYEVSDDGKEYVGYQKIPGYGAHFCYVCSGDVIVKKEQESGSIILDDSTCVEENVHPLIQKYVKEIQSCMPPERTPNKFKYHDLTESFGGMDIPSVDPDDDVVWDYEIVNHQGGIGQEHPEFEDDLNNTGDNYDQFARRLSDHERPRVGLKETIIEKEQKTRALQEQQIQNQGVVVPQPTPKIKRTIQTRVRAVHLEPVSVDGNKIALMSHVRRDPRDKTPTSRQQLIQAMHDLEEEVQKSQGSSNNSSEIPPNIQQAIDKVWKNPLMRDLGPLSEHRSSLPLPPKIKIIKGEEERRQSY